MKYNYISIEGNIGAGKTTLATKIANDFNAKLILEEFEENAFLPKFYKDPDRYAFQLELAFLAQRYKQLSEHLISQDLFKKFTVSDYFINKSLIFARKTLQNDEFLLYSNLFNIIKTSLPQPDLLVYLFVDVDNLIRNIEKRGRSYEQNIQRTYLEKIQASYFEFLKQQQDMRILIIDTNDIDFLNNEDDYKKILNVINKTYEPGIYRTSL
ncbi:MAG: deoxynucleoside kinase [Bacteroidales bacterium]|nr:deoxynucleoside kinase [Bacteroidales bacterium]